MWVWCPNASAIADGTAMKYYPGGTYVDWVCGDGYNFAPRRPGDKWETMGEIYDGFYARATKLNKPIMIGEFGVRERNPGEKEQWFRQAHDWIQAHPAVAAVVYFNADSTTNDIYYDWRVDTTPSAVEGFRYLFTGTAPEKPLYFERPGGNPPPAATSDPVVTPAGEQAVVAAPKQPRPKTETPAAGPAVAGSDLSGSATSGDSGSPGRGRVPSARLTWVLEMLRQLDAASVAT
jgi:hypothetical protein